MKRIREVIVIVLIVLIVLIKASDTHPTLILLFALEFFSKSSMHVRVVFGFQVLLLLSSPSSFIVTPLNHLLGNNKVS